MKEKLDRKEIRENIKNKLSRHYGITIEEATKAQMYKSCARTVLEILLEKRAEYNQKLKKNQNKKVYYLCMEFLVGRSLKNNLYNLGLNQVFQDVLADFGKESAGK